GELPALEGLALAPPEPAELLLRRDVQPELDEDHALERLRPLELDDLLVRAALLVHAREPLHALDEHPAVPGAVEHGHPAPAGKGGDEAGQVVMAPVVVVGGAEGGHAHMSLVEVGHQALDRAALA